MRVDIPSENRILTTEDFRVLAEAINANRISSVSGLELRSSSNGVGLHNPSAFAKTQESDTTDDSGIKLLRVFWARITAVYDYNVIFGAPLSGGKWAYGWNQVTFRPRAEDNAWGNGVSSWPNVVETNSSNPISGSSAFNWAEDMNPDRAGVAIMHNGVDMGTEGYVPLTMVLRPCPVGAIVRMHEFVVPGKSKTRRYWFEYINGIDGPCSEEEA